MATLVAFAVVVLSATVAVAGDGNRTLTFVNSCPSQTLRIGVNGGFVEKCSGSGNTCPAGTSCLIQGGKPKGCFWDLPTFDRVLAPGGSVAVAVDNKAHKSTKWSGNFYASSGCDSNGENCQAGACPSGTCPTGVGPNGPTTLAEITMQDDGVDTYDVSLINGVNVPIAIGPTALPLLDAVKTAANSNPYYCQEAGSAAASGTGLSACTWSFTPPTVGGVSTADRLPLVTTGGAACGGGATCSSGQVCGYPVGATQAQQSCGTQLGWWSADELCIAISSGLGAPFNCNTKVTGQGTQKDLYACAGPTAGVSCYSASAPDTCCGCPSWKAGGSALPLAAGFSCANTNAQWTSLSEPFAKFLKDACPTGYSFPYDDGTSTFTCASNASPSKTDPNSVGYTVTFCPGGNTGF